MADLRELPDDMPGTDWPIVIITVVAALLPGIVIGIGLGWWWFGT